MFSETRCSGIFLQYLKYNGKTGVYIVIFVQISSIEVSLLIVPSCCTLVSNVSGASETGFLLDETKQ